MPIGGGLYDRPENRPQQEATQAAKIREWVFWGCMALGVIAILQVQPAALFTILLVTAIIASIVWLIKQIADQLKDIGR